jgi:DNA polymerase-3 subunit alpha
VNEAGEIVFGLGAIKGVGEAAIAQLVEERDQNGSYLNLFDFCERQDTRKINRRALEALIRSGSMDEFKVERSWLVASLDKALRMVEQNTKAAQLGQNDLFAMIGDAATAVKEVISYVEAPAWTDAERLKGEKETIGYYISGHPLQTYKDEIRQFSLHEIGNLAECLGQMVTVAGLVLGMRTIITRTGKRMAILNIEDTSGRIEVTVFGEIYEKSREDIAKDQVIAIKGEVAKDEFNGGIKLVAESVTSLDQMRRKLARRLVLKMPAVVSIEDFVTKLGSVLKPYGGGRCPVVISYQDQQARARIELGKEWSIHLTNELLSALISHYGADAIQIEY